MNAKQFREALDKFDRVCSSAWVYALTDMDIMVSAFSCAGIGEQAPMAHHAHIAALINKISVGKTVYPDQDEFVVCTGEGLTFPLRLSELRKQFEEVRSASESSDRFDKLEIKFSQPMYFMFNGYVNDKVTLNDIISPYPTWLANMVNRRVKNKEEAISPEDTFVDGLTRLVHWANVESVEIGQTKDVYPDKYFRDQFDDKTGSVLLLRTSKWTPPAFENFNMEERQ